MSRKVYTIRITSSKDHPDIWYSNKIGRVYDAVLNVIPHHRNSTICFNAGSSHFVYPEDCEVLKENIINEEENLR